MDLAPINWWAVIVAAIVKFAIGALWYSPALFSKQWQAETNTTDEQFRANFLPATIAELITDVVMAYVLARFIAGLAVATILGGIIVGALAWVGFVAAIGITRIYYERSSWRLFAINNGYLLIALLVMGAILAIWR
jgi:hypothetical protein